MRPLFEAACYSLFGSSKRLRPLLFLSLLEEVGFPIVRALDVACAIECIHTYSLIHDDLPCMDDADIRRGKPALHKKTSEWMALLTGDFLLTKAFELIARAPLDGVLIAKLIRVLSPAIGAHGMVGGQMADLAYSQEEKWLLWIHMHKTAKLFEGIFEMAALLAALPCEDIFHLKQIGLSFGLVFQLLDDKKDGDRAFIYLDKKGFDAKIGEAVRHMEIHWDKLSRSFDKTHTWIRCFLSY